MPKTIIPLAWVDKKRIFSDQDLYIECEDITEEYNENPTIINNHEFIVFTTKDGELELFFNRKTKNNIYILSDRVFKIYKITGYSSKTALKKVSFTFTSSIFISNIITPKSQNIIIKNNKNFLKYEISKHSIILRENFHEEQKIQSLLDKDGNYIEEKYKIMNDNSELLKKELNLIKEKIIKEESAIGKFSKEKIKEIIKNLKEEEKFEKFKILNIYFDNTSILVLRLDIPYLYHYHTFRISHESCIDVHDKVFGKINIMPGCILEIYLNKNYKFAFKYFPKDEFGEGHFRHPHLSVVENSPRWCLGSFEGVFQSAIKNKDFEKYCINAIELMHHYNSDDPFYKTRTSLLKYNDDINGNKEFEQTYKNITKIKKIPIPKFVKIEYGIDNLLQFKELKNNIKRTTATLELKELGNDMEFKLLGKDKIVKKNDLEIKKTDKEINMEALEWLSRAIEKNKVPELQAYLDYLIKNNITEINYEELPF